MPSIFELHQDTPKITAMEIRPSTDIYPPYYLDPPQDEEVRRECMAHLNDSVQVARDVYGWIDRKNCPYRREHYAGMMTQCISELLEDGFQINYELRLEVEAKLLKIIRYAQTDQVAMEIVAKERQQQLPDSRPEYAVDPERYTHEERMQHMERQVDNLTRLVERLVKEKETHVCSYIMPGQIKTMVEIDQELRDACGHSGPTLAKYLKKAQALRYVDFRGDGLPTLYETLRSYYTMHCGYDAFYRACIRNEFFPSGQQI